MPDRDVFIISAVRTAIGLGGPGGLLNPFQPIDLAVAVLVDAVRRAEIRPDRVDDVLWGLASPLAEPAGNVGRLVWLKAGFPGSVPGVQVNRLWASGQQAIHFGAQTILAGDADIVVVGGTGMRSDKLFGVEQRGEWTQAGKMLTGMAENARQLAARWSLSREEQAEYALQSHARAGAAIKNGYFDEQILALSLPGGGLFRVDEVVEVGQDGPVILDIAAQFAAGAAALVLASAEAVGKLNLMPMARIEARVVVGSDSANELNALVAAAQLAFRRSGLSLAEMDVIEINEDSAALVLAWAQEMGADLQKVNPNGGALAYGQPEGAMGAILMTKLVYELERRRARFGLQCMCSGDGMAMATIIERV